MSHATHMNESLYHCWNPKIATLSIFTLQHTATGCNTLPCTTLQHAATHCNTLHHAATHCITPQHNASHCNTVSQVRVHRQRRQRTAATDCGNTLQHTATHCNTLHHTEIHCINLQHTDHPATHNTATQCSSAGAQATAVTARMLS